MSGIKLAVGKKFLDRFDNEWVVISFTPGWTYPYLAHNKRTNTDESYTADGNWSNYTGMPCDLVREAATQETPK